jgi:hypothetical protein
LEDDVGSACCVTNTGAGTKKLAGFRVREFRRNKIGVPEGRVPVHALE